MLSRYVVCLFLACSLGMCGADSAKSEPSATIDQALGQLVSGNQRYCEKSMEHPHQAGSRRAELAKSQHPYAVVLGCADSRVPPEVVFDQGLGDLFVVRVAGNVPSDEVIASLEYAVAHLGVKLIVVLGHSRCGAVAATLEGGAAEGRLPTLEHRIQPAVEKARKQGGDVLDNAVRINVENTVSQLRASGPILAEAVRDGKIRVVGARYSLDTGRVEFLP